MLISTISVAHAAAPIIIQKNFCIANINHMPQYKITFTIPWRAKDEYTPPDGKPIDRDRFLVLRYYQPWGDGTATGWQQLVNLPTVTFDGQPLMLSTVFAYSNPEWFNYGSVGLGYDQYAQYFGVDIPEPTNLLGATLTIAGPFQQTAYFSATLYAGYYDEGSHTELAGYQEELIDSAMLTLPLPCNPYVEGHPSVFAYPAPTSEMALNNQHPATFLNQKDKNAMLDNLPISTTHQISVYRLDRYESARVIADDIAPDGCSRAYLIGQMASGQDVAILRIKVPTTFIDSDNPNKIYSHYQAQYFSVGSHRNPPADPTDLLSYWAVNARMLRDYMDDQGYAYVFFAPNAYTNNLAIEQNTPPTQPPIMTWGRYKGYLLGEPDFAIILRYRAPDSSWKGSPENAKCYATPKQLQPVTVAELGEYTPEIFGDTLDNFLKGHIGSVDKDSAWPITAASKAE
ncbi:MAG: hypothetical protein EPO11_09140 [Gammaproteobacteria bacterium]|nr:MAG: hypothetical protein EPO11_09140 [Gammaproteobacteria bacterium]